MGDSGEFADGLVLLVAQQVVELRIDFLQVIGNLGDGLLQGHLRHDAADAGEHGGVELPRLSEFQMLDDAPIRLPYNAGLECSFLAVLAIFGDQLGRFFGELHPAPAFDHGIAGLLRALARHRDGLHGFGLERLGIEALIFKPQIYSSGVTEECDALFVLNDGDALCVFCVIISGAVVGAIVSTIGWDEFFGTVVNHGFLSVLLNQHSYWICLSDVSTVDARLSLYLCVS